MTDRKETAAGPRFGSSSRPGLGSTLKDDVLLSGNAKAEAAAPGPGHYTVTGGRRGPAFSLGERVFAPTQAKADVPGPGAYHVEWDIVEGTRDKSSVR